ncbi:MAG: hypothetical protein Q4F07_06810 [Bacteroidales bacterium]|nr:hypothetical protein [Bacteroidales bacterium]
MRKTRRIDFNYRPLQISASLTTEGSVPGRQSYDAVSGEYSPDYTLTPLMLQPMVSVIDKDGIISSGTINASLANITWTVTEGTQTRVITDSDTDYTIERSGPHAGRLTVRRNAMQGVPLILEFQAEYADTRTGQLYSVMARHTVRCDNATAAPPVLTLDAAAQEVYNPLRDADTRTITATLMLGKSVCPDSRCRFIWQKMRPDGSWSDVGADPVLDYDVEVSATTASVTVRRTLMGTELSLRCIAVYDGDGHPETVTPDDSAPMAYTVLRRRIPRYDYDIDRVPVSIPPEQAAISPVASLGDTQGIIDNYLSVLMPLWYIATNKPGTQPSYRQVAHGVSPSISTAALNAATGATLALEMVDLGAPAALTDSDGAVLTDSDGSVLLT